MRSFIRSLALILLATSAASTIQANRNQDVDGSCCPRSGCYECGCNPLYCGAFDVQGHAGVAPIFWTDRGDISFVQCTSNPLTSGIAFLFEVPHFFKLFRIPWTVGGQVGYAVNENIRVFVEFNYLQAKGKGNALITTVSTTPQTIAFSMGKYELFDVYLGAQYYWNRWCDYTSFFVGAKVGLTHRKRTHFSSTLTSATIVPPVVLTTDTDFFHRNTIPSGGLELGLDFCMCGNWSVQLVGEVVASCGPRSARIDFGQISGCAVVQAVPVAGINNFIIGHIGTELRFPITLGIRYSF